MEEHVSHVRTRDRGRVATLESWIIKLTCAINRNPSTSSISMASPIIQCVLCGIPSPSLKLFVSHLRSVHGKDLNFNVMCNISECREVFRAFSAFNSHVYRHHCVVVRLDKPVAVCDDAQSNDSCVVPIFFFFNS